MQVDHFLKYFPADQMHFMLFEDLLSNPMSSALKLFDFLGLHDCDITHLTFPHSNSTRLPFSKNFQYFSRKYGYNTYSHFGYRFLSNLNRTAQSFFPRNYSIDISTYNYLIDLFMPHNKRLATLTGLNLDAWSY